LQCSIIPFEGHGMRTNTVARQASKDSIPYFELCSVILLAAFVMGAASAAHAQGATPSTSGVIDTTQSAPSQMRVAADAAPARKVTSMDLDAAFNRADVDRDGQLSRTEAEHFPAVAQRFEQIDSNRDTFISREEFYKAVSN
jgi:hypothetical protein